MNHRTDYLDRPIYSLQTMLRQISTVDPSVLPTIPNGVFNQATSKSVQSFQRTYGLPACGTVDQATWDRIVEVHNRVLPFFRPLQHPLPQSPGNKLRPGEYNTHVRLVQVMLQVLSLQFELLRMPSVTGTLDSETAQGLQWVQKAAGLPVDGCLDTQTWNALICLYRASIGDGNESYTYG